MRAGLGGRSIRYAGARPSESLRGWRLLGLTPPSSGGLLVAIAVMLPAWALVFVFAFDLTSRFGPAGPAGPVIRSGQATVESCDRTWPLATQHRCVADVRWDDGSASTEVEIVAVRPLGGGARVNQHGSAGGQPGGQVVPVGNPAAPEWTSYLVLIAFFLPGTAVAARCGLWVGNLILPPEPRRGRSRSRSAFPQITAHPDNTHQVRLSPGRQVEPSHLPSGHGAVLVRTRYQRWLAARQDTPEPPVVGIDGRAAVFGWGTALLTLPAGQHLVQVQLASRPDGERVIEVPGGKIVEVAYAASGSRRLRGVVGPPGVVQPGVPRALPIAFAVWLVAQWTAHWSGVAPATGWALFVAGPIVYLGGVVAKIGLDRRTRRRASGVSSAATGDSAPRLIGAAKQPERSDRMAAVVLGFAFRRASGDGTGIPRWVPAPVLRIDGKELPASWSTWWYPVAPGWHDVEVVAPVAAAIRADAGAGTARRLTYQLDLREAGAQASAALEIDGLEPGPDSPRVPRMRKHEDSPYEVWHPHAGTQGLPQGYGAVVVRTWFGTWLPKRRLNFRLAQRPTVGIDGQPVLQGWGTAQVVVPAGRRLVQVQTVRPEAERIVDVPAGGVVKLEYAAPRHIGWSRGVLGPPGQRQPGAPHFTTAVCIFLGFLALYYGVARWALPDDLLDSPLLALWLPLIIVTLLGMGVVKRHLDRRARCRAQGPARPVTPAGSDRHPPQLVGAATPPEPPTGWGAIVLTSSFYRDMFRIDGELFPVEDDPSAWVPPPLVHIDGREVAAGWSSWWYPVAPGSHTVEIVRPSHASVQVDVAAGGTRYLHYHVDTRTMVGGASGAAAANARHGGDSGRFVAVPPTKARQSTPGVGVVGDRVAATLVRDSDRAGRAKATGVAHLHASPRARREWMVMFHFSRRRVE